jgi:predicted PurR-regulated permease PerM
MMQEFEVKTSSWHFRFIAFMAGYRKNKVSRKNDRIIQDIKSYNDFCSYWRLFMWQIVRTIFYAVTAGFVALFALIVAVVVFDGIVQDPMGALFVFLGSIGAIVVLILIVISPEIFKDVRQRMRNRKNRKTYIDHVNGVKPKAPGIFETKYRAWKDKICPSISFKD